jgi:hypothetical protein
VPKSGLSQAGPTFVAGGRTPAFLGVFWITTTPRQRIGTRLWHSPTITQQSPSDCAEVNGLQTQP